MKNLILPTIFFVFFSMISISAQQDVKTFDVANFDKIIISPHIAVNLVEGDIESVRIDQAGVPEDRINVAVEGNTLRIYLEGAKTVTKNEKVKGGDYKTSKPLYNGTQVRATVTYRTLSSLSVRGGERIQCGSIIDQKEFSLHIYGESQVYLSHVDLEKLKVVIYGESYLEVENGTVGYQKFTAYGESKVNTMAMTNSSAKITAYGESDFRVSVADRLKVTCYGETHITYQGNPDVDRGIVIGEATIKKIG